MLTTRQTQTVTLTPVLSRISAAVRWPFTNSYASPIWLAVRLYLAYIWLTFGLSKFEAGWLTHDAVGDMFKSIAAGHLPVPLAFFRGVAQTMLDLGVSSVLSSTVPFLELAVGLAMISGVLLVPAAIGGSLLIVNIILMGIGSLAFDGRLIAYQLLLVAAYRVAGVIGVERLLVRILTHLYRKVRPAKAAVRA